MRSRVVAVLVCSVALAASVAGLAGAQYYAFCPFGSSLLPGGCDPAGNITLQLDGGFEPRKLPRGKKAPITLEIRGSIWNKDGTHVPALREVAFVFDKHVSVEAGGLPLCRRAQLERRVTGEARRLCRRAIVGRGTALIQARGAEGYPSSIPARLTIFNGGVAASVTKLFIHATLAVPEPIPAVATVAINETDQGRYGLASVTRIPQILDGTGSVVNFHFKIERGFEHNGAQRSYLMARCVDGRLQANMTGAVFIQEVAGRTKTVISKTLFKPCTPTG